jgi:hypothetical protein
MYSFHYVCHFFLVDGRGKHPAACVSSDIVCGVGVQTRFWRAHRPILFLLGAFVCGLDPVFQIILWPPVERWGTPIYFQGFNDNR